MSEDQKSNSLQSWLGWIVAVGALLVAFLQYLDTHSLINKTEAEIPVFDFEITTFEKSRIPSDLLKLMPASIWDDKSEIKNDFSVYHVRGKPVSGIEVVFKSSSKPIENIVLLEGALHTNITYSKNRLEAVLKRDRLTKKTPLKGHVITAGITTVDIHASAAEGDKYTPSKQSGWNWERSLIVAALVLVFGFLILFFGWLGSRAFKHVQKEEDSNYFDVTKENTFLVAAILVIALLPDFPFSLSELFYGLALYFLISRYDLLISVLKVARGNSNN